MSKTYQRPESSYAGSSELLNREKYQVDAQSEPPVPISSEKIDSDFNYVVDAINELNLAAGVHSTIDERLNTSLNTDGTLKANVVATITDWVEHTGVVTIEGNEITLTGLYDSLYVQGNVIKAQNGAVETFLSVIAVNITSNKTKLTVEPLEGNMPTLLDKLYYSAYKKDALSNTYKKLWLKTGDTKLVQRMTSANTDMRLSLMDNELSIEENTGTALSPTWIESGLLKGSSVKESSIPANRLEAGVLGSVAAKNTGTLADQVPLLNSEGKLEKSILPFTGGAIGSISIFPTEEAVPVDHLILNGASFNQSTYPELFTVLGDSASLPDWRGYFPRMADLGSGIDSGRAVGSFQQDELRSHKHESPLRVAPTYTGVSGAYENINSYISTDTGRVTARSTGNATAVRPFVSDTGGSETRPKNVAVIFAIKAE